ncbi:type III PLP-dependent enzyme [Nitrospirillum sp. BR 11828]|uniref:type III PLP-dependent enzyme n=1 Tax=Nitrospirillum sp. BR 11828 TaxID=3104325 RepID=UPI002ACA5120|nr:type III PLP-dependent enzyme [Nitrospirillum sp. BR 11828]MDZ5649407.1 type III PLP-dependent enzyme [Nitrospirillum sp. BR 11828]
MAYRFRSAVSPLRRVRAQSLPSALPVAAPTVDSLVASLAPAEPMHCLRPRQVAANARAFIAAFHDAVAQALGDGDRGTVMYAVKCNPDPTMLRALTEGGLRHFDCASPAEIRLARQMYPSAAVHYMHPVKNRAAIRAAYFEQAVRDFSLDSADELAKIVEVVAEGGSRGGVPGGEGVDARLDPVAADLGLVIRLAMPKGQAAYDLSAKFGAAFDDAVALLRAARPLAMRVGVCFHVGSQCMDPQAYTRALAIADAVVKAAGVAIDVVDVGGGFPARYPDMDPPPLADYMAAIRDGLVAMNLAPNVQVWCEPGRALVATGASVVVQVERRRGSELFINDGAYGSLADAGALGMRFPVRLIRQSGAETLQEFSFWGPTCDSADYMRGPFLLPADIREGDWIEIGQLGAYGAALRTAFNGFDQARLVEVRDAPLVATAGLVPAPVRRNSRYGILRRRIA